MEKVCELEAANDCKQTVFAKHSKTEAYMDSWTHEVTACTRPVQAQSIQLPSMERMANGHKVLALAEKLLPSVSCQERGIS